MSSTFSVSVDDIDEFVSRLASAFDVLSPSERPEIFVDPNKRIAEGYGNVVQIRPVGSRQTWWHYHSETERCVSDLLESLGVDLSDPNFEETPRRMSSYFREHFLDPQETDRSLTQVSKSSFPSEYSGMIAQSGIRVNGICPHHGLPILLTIGIGYIPSGKVIGLSKLARIAKLIGCQPFLQEDITFKIADALCIALETNHVAVVVEGVHMCMSIRGVEQSDTITTTAEVRGHFRDNSQDAKTEFMAYIQRSR